MLLKTWIFETDILEAEDVLRLDMSMEGADEKYAVFYNNEAETRWVQVSEWSSFERAMEDLQTMIFLYAEVTPALVYSPKTETTDELAMLFWMAESVVIPGEKVKAHV